MADRVDVLFINPGDGKQIYQDLGEEFSAIEPPVFVRLFRTYVRQKGHSEPIYDAAIRGGVDLPDMWKDFHQHGYNAKPLSNQFCTAAEILEFRDNTIDQYFTSPTYLNMAKEEFGQDVVDHVS